MSKKITIIGSGSFGTAIAKVLYDGGHRNIIIFGIAKNELKDLQIGKNTKYFKNLELPLFKTTMDMQIAINNADIIVLAVPSDVIDKVLQQVVVNINKKTLIVNIAKGFYPNKEQTLHEGIMEKIQNNSNIKGVVSLIGPSHAKEVICSMPTLVASVSFDKNLCQEVQTLFANSYFKVYIQTDVKGAMVGASYKNVIAIASGMVHGIGYGFNTIAALLTRGLKEMQKFNKFIGGKSETIYGLTGIGDLIVTATSPLSRNWNFGNNFIKKNQTSLNTNKTIEGLLALKYIFKIARKHSLDLPIVFALYSIIFEKANYKIIFKELWNRNAKQE